MGAVHFHLDVQLVETLLEVQQFGCFVETGTFHGDTVAAVRALFPRVVSIELSPTLQVEAVERFRSDDHIEILLGDSATMLARVARQQHGPTLYYLDAHWCVAQDTAGEASQCPLLAELAAIGSLDKASVVLIDDARLFLAPPAAPHEISQWPTFQQILDALQKLSGRHHLTVVNDVIAFYPPQFEPAVVSYARSSGLDWLHAAQSLAAVSGLHAQLKEKEEVIVSLAEALHAREGEVAALQQSTVAPQRETPSQTHLLEEELQRKEQFVQDQERTLQAYRVVLSSALVVVRELIQQRSTDLLVEPEASSAAAIAASTQMADLEAQLLAKDLVIQEQDRALQAFHAVLPRQRRARQLAQAHRNALTSLPGKPRPHRDLRVADAGVSPTRVEHRALSIAQRTLRLVQKTALSEGLRSELQDREREVASLREALGGVHQVDSAQLLALHEQLEKKELVIQEQQRALNTYRSILPLTRGVLPLLHRVRSLLHRLMERLGYSPHHVASTSALHEGMPKQDGDALEMAMMALRAAQGSSTGEGRHTDLQALEHQIQALQAEETAARDNDSISLFDINTELARMEALIQAQGRALRLYRVVLPLARPFLRAAQAGRLAGRVLQPKLGRLHHHEPIPMRLPAATRAQPAGGKRPLVSIVTPSFRQARFLARTIDSVLHQDYSPLEYFIQDGGSQDGSVDVLQSYGNRLTGWVSAPDGGQSQAINAGFARTSGEIMAWLNSDDLLLPGALNTVSAYFAKHPEVDVVYGHRILIDEEDREIGRWVLPPHNNEVLSWADFVPQETMFWRRSLWEKVGGIDESFRFAMDWDLLLRFRDAGARMVRLPVFLGAFRIHEAQKTSAAINEIGMEEMRRLRFRALGREASHLEIRRALASYMVQHIGHDLVFRVKRRLGRG